MRYLRPILLLALIAPSLVLPDCDNGDDDNR